MAIPSKPTADPTWATNANYAGGPLVGTPTKVDPSAGIRADGYQPAVPAGAQHTNHVQNAQGQWIEWAEAGIDDLASRVGGDDGTAEFLYGDGPRTSEVLLHPADASMNWSNGPAWDIEIGSANHAQSIVDRAVLCFALNQMLPTGATLTRVRLMIDPGAARATPTDRVRMTIKTHTPDFGTPASPSNNTLFDGFDDGTNNLQVIDSGALSHSVDNASDMITVLVAAGNDGAANPDRVYSLQLTFADPGPRNS